MKFSRRLGVRLSLILCVLLLIVLVQLITLTRLSTPNKYPWEDEELKAAYSKRNADEFRGGVRNPLEDQEKPPISPEENNHRTSRDPATNTSVKTQRIFKQKNETSGKPGVISHFPELSSRSTETTTSPNCEPSGKDALSALERAKTSICKQKIHETICLAQENKIYNVSLKNECPIGRNPAKQFKPVPYSDGKGPSIRIVFLMSIHGRAVREVKRVFKAIYHSDHYYYIHVDYNSDYLYEELKLAFRDLPNVYFPKWRMATIWGGASLLQMLLRALEELEYLLIKWEWDFFINISESDFPLKTNEELVQFLRVHRKSNFVKTHGGDIKKFIQKQGLDRTFVECDYHMWRIGNRPLPQDITIDGGSDWIVINRNYSHYLINNQGPFLKGLKKYYEYSLLPAESFFHTVLRNGPLCDTLVRSNLRITNWNRKLGCRCQYKHIVDWCGCSPNDFLNKDLDKVKNPKDDQFFARKFEAIVNQHVINELDAHLYGSYPDDTPGLNSYWENLYHHKFDVKPPSSSHYTVYHSFMRIAVSHMSMQKDELKQSNDCFAVDKLKLTEVFVYYHEDHFVGYVTRFEGAEEGSGSHIFESLYVPIEHQVASDTDTCPKLRSASVEVGSKWDGKESIFRNYGGILGINDQPTVAIRMKIGRLCHLDISWINPLGIVEQKTELKLEPGATVNTQKLNSEEPIMPGKWAVRIATSTSLFVEKQFVIYPVTFNEDGEPLSEPSLLNAKRMTLLKPGMDAEKYMEWRINVLKNAAEYKGWLDKLVSEYWSLKSTCSYLPSVRTKKGCTTSLSCNTSSWSSYYPDIKSEIIPINSLGRIR